MARPVKKGLLYFPLDCQLDLKFELIEAEFGLKGFAVIVKLYQYIYGGDKEYYCEWSPEVSLVFAKRIGAGANDVSEIVQAALKRGIFDNGMFSEYGILTSAGIQKRFLEIKSRSKYAEIESKYLLINCAQNSSYCNKNPDYCYNNSGLSDNNAPKVKQSKSKENKSKSKAVVSGKPPLVADADRRFKLVQKFGDDTVRIYERHYDEWAKDKSGIKRDKYDIIEEWIVKDNKNNAGAAKPAGSFDNGSVLAAIFAQYNGGERASAEMGEGNEKQC